MAVVQMIKDGPSDTIATGQVATIKWWLRQSWEDSRLRWDPDKYAYSSGNGTATVDSISRPPGSFGGVWIPDMVSGHRRSRKESTPPMPSQRHSDTAEHVQMLWESKFDGKQQTAGLDEPTRVEIGWSGWVFWSIPQLVHLNMVDSAGALATHTSACPSV